MSFFTSLLASCGLNSQRLYRLLSMNPTPQGYARFLEKFGHFYHFGNHCQIALSARIESPANVFIGNHVVLGHCILRSGDGFLDYTSPLQEESLTVIGNHAYIGDNADIYPGVCIGAHAQIMPGATVATDVEEYGVVYSDQNNTADVRVKHSTGPDTTMPVEPLLASNNAC